jgi:hypothetical protein
MQFGRCFLYLALPGGTKYFARMFAETWKILELTFSKVLAKIFLATKTFCQNLAWHRQMPESSYKLKIDFSYQNARSGIQNANRYR